MSRRLVALVAAGVIVIGACGAQPSPGPSGTSSPTVAPTETPPAATPSPPDLVHSDYAPEPVGHTGGTLTYAGWLSIATLNPYYATRESDREAATPALLGMLTVTPDLKWVGFPHMAISDNVPLATNGDVTVTGSRMDVRYRIHSGLKWSDGTDITCADMEATWTWIMDAAQRGLADGTTGWKSIDSIEDRGGGTCVVHFREVYEGYLDLFSPLLPKAYIEEIPVADAPAGLYPLTDVASGVYSGPYIPARYTLGAQLEYRPNEFYWTPTGKLVPFDAFVFKYYSDPYAMKVAFDQARFDVGVNLDHYDLRNLADGTKCTGPRTPAGCNLIVGDTLTYEQLSIQNRSLETKFGHDSVQAIKLALALTIDKSAIAEGPLRGTVEPTGSNNQSPLFWWYKEEPPSELDPGRAASLLDQAGWIRGPDGFRQRNGVTLALDYCTLNTADYRSETLGLIAGQLGDIGIEVDALFVPPKPDLLGRWGEVPGDTPCNLSHGNFDVAQFAWVVPLDPLGGYDVYTCQAIPEDDPQHAGRNYTRTCDPQLDRALGIVRSTVDLAAIRDAMWLVQDYYSSNTVEIPLFFWKSVHLVNPRLHNMAPNPGNGTILWNIDDQWSEG